MKITILKPSNGLNGLAVQGAQEWIGTTISFKLYEGDKKTLLKNHPEIQGQLEQQVNNQCTLLSFHHNNWKDYTPMFAECSYTWAQFLSSLKRFCETSKGKPWPTQHRL